MKILQTIRQHLKFGLLLIVGFVSIPLFFFTLILLEDLERDYNENN